eukprot:3235522-Rhodomonas_salina.2
MTRKMKDCDGIGELKQAFPVPRSWWWCGGVVVVVFWDCGATGDEAYPTWLLRVWARARTLMMLWGVQVFKQVDMDGDQYISAADLRLALSQLAGQDLRPEEIEELMRYARRDPCDVTRET